MAMLEPGHLAGRLQAGERLLDLPAQLRRGLRFLDGIAASRDQRRDGGEQHDAHETHPRNPHHLNLPFGKSRAAEKSAA